MKSRRILVVDDHPHMIHVLRLYLERAGYQVETARNGQVALAAILENPPDLLVTDIRMPGMDGRELCDALKAQLPQRTFPILVMTSLTDLVHREWIESTGDAFLLEKPLSMRLLTTRVAAIFAASDTEPEPANG